MLYCFIYFVVFLFVFVMNYLAVKWNGRNGGRAMLFLGFICLMLFMGLRYNVGTDYNSYLELYEEVTNTPFNELIALRTEIFTSVLFKIVSFITSEPKLIFVAIAFLQLWPIYKANNLYNNKYLPFSILIYCMLFLPFCLNGMRQGIAMGFTLLSYVYLTKNNYKKAAINMAIAALFHMTALVCLPYIVLVFLYRKRGSITKPNIVLTAFLTYVVLFLLNDILIGYEMDRYKYVLGMINTNEFNVSAIMIFLPIIILNIVLLVINEKKSNNEINKFSNLAISGHVFYTVGSVAKYLYRFGLYFMTLDIITIPHMINNVSNKKIRVLLESTLIIYLVAFFYVQFYIWGRHEILPYQTWIFGDM